MQVEDTNAYVPSVVLSLNRRRRRNALNDENTKSALAGKLLSNEHEEWTQKRFKGLVTHSHNAKVSHVTHSPGTSNIIAVASSARISLYQAANGEPCRRASLNRVQGTVYGCSFRSDAAVLSCGGEEKIIRVFDLSSRTVLRDMRNGHSDAIHSTLFSTANAYTLFSAGDDGVVNVWDMRTKHRVVKGGFRHADKVRAIALGLSAEHEICSGGYDNMVKLWDLRKPELPVYEANHGAQIECLTWVKRKLLTGGGNGVKVWDVQGLRKELHHFTTHKKHVTSFALASGGTRLLTAGLDEFIQVHNADTFRVVASLRMPAPILAISMSENDDLSLAVGMVDGSLHIKYQVKANADEPSAAEGKVRKAKRPKHSASSSDEDEDADGLSEEDEALAADADGEMDGEFKDPELDKKLDDFLKQRMRSQKGSDNTTILYRASGFVQINTKSLDTRYSHGQIVPDTRTQRTINSKWDILLRKFKHQEALDEVMKHGNPVHIVALLEQLVKRDALQSALQPRDEKFLVDFLDFIRMYFDEAQHTRVLTICLERVLELYGDVQTLSESFRRVLKDTRTLIKQELMVQADLFKLKGTMELIFSSAAAVSRIQQDQ
eukprot:TRINITY_DN4064_c0_g1_i2.p1 TRINITY_DN4064_c0_g1~~TRINITY_DN4064_c0_g1_i2.p1  ORF type:complete len:612 (-),score=165.38 TRINITY_DN4064_c0_g1_i2:1435-3249(-)